MPSTYTTNNGIEKIGTGEQSGTWGDTTNLNFDILDQALDGQVTVTATDVGSAGSPNTLPITDGSLSDGRNRLIIITDGGDLGGSVYYQLTPADAEKIIFLRNDLSGSQDLILFQGTYNASRDLIVPAGKDVIIKFSGGGTSNAVVAPVFADLSLDAATIASVDINGGTIDGVTIGTNAVATDIRVDNLQLDGNTLSSTDTDGNVVIAPNGDGDVQLDADTIRVGDSNTDVTITTNGSGDLTLNTNGGTDSGSIEIQDGANTNIIVTANGTGKLELANGDITTSAASGSDAAGQDLTIQAGASTGNAAGGDMIFQTTPAGAGSGSVLNSYTTVLTLTDDSKMQIGTSTAVDSILDEDDMTSDSATALATQQSIKAYVDSQVGTVDTWSEVLANGNTSGATDAVITAGQKITTDTIEETTADAGVKVDTFTLKDNEVSIDAASGTDQAGTNVIVSGGAGTGTGAGGELLFKVAPAGSTGSSVNALATGMKLDSTKALYVDTINELTSAAGVTIDSVLLKDDVVNATDIETSTISANDGTTAINIADSTGDVDIDNDLNVDGEITGTTAVLSTATNTAQLTLKCTDDDANVGPVFDLTRDSANPAADDGLAQIRFNGKDDAGNELSYAHMRAFIVDPTDGSEDGKFEIDVREAGGQRSRLLFNSTETVINNESRAYDFTVKSDNSANMLYVDGTNDRVGINNSSPAKTLHVSEASTAEVRVQNSTNNYALDLGMNDTLGQVKASADLALMPGGIEKWRIDSSGNVTQTNTGTGAGAGPYFNLVRNSSSPAASDDIGIIQFGGKNDADESVNYANISSMIIDPTDASEDGRWTLNVIKDGSMVERIRANATELTINEPAEAMDFRVKSDSEGYMLYVDGTNDQVSVGGAQNVTNPVSGDNIGPKFVVEHTTATSIGVLRKDTTVVSGNSIGSLGFYGIDTTSNTPRALAAVQAVAAGTHGAGDNPTELRFYTTPDNSETLTERVTITQGGEVQLATDSAFKTDSTATSATTQTAVYSFSATTYTGAKFLVCVTDSTDTERYITELLVTHDGTTAVATEYGQVATDTALATFDVDISGGNVRLLATPESSNSMTFKVMSTQLLA